VQPWWLLQLHAHQAHQQVSMHISRSSYVMVHTAAVASVRVFAMAGGL
jgi:hypothetical protein